MEPILPDPGAGDPGPTQKRDPTRFVADRPSRGECTACATSVHGCATDKRLRPRAFSPSWRSDRCFRPKRCRIGVVSASFSAKPRRRNAPCGAFLRRSLVVPSRPNSEQVSRRGESIARTVCLVESYQLEKPPGVGANCEPRPRSRLSDRRHLDRPDTGHSSPSRCGVVPSAG
jgi:hypothetical protein